MLIAMKEWLPMCRDVCKISFDGNVVGLKASSELSCGINSVCDCD
jgi:hypothetical protein